MHIPMNGKIGLITGYAVSGTTGVAGALASTAQKAVEINPHIYHHHLLGLEYSEVAVLVGILGTISTMLLQFLTYKRLKAKDAARDSDNTSVEEK